MTRHFNTCRSKRETQNNLERKFLPGGPVINACLLGIGGNDATDDTADADVDKSSLSLCSAITRFGKDHQ